MNKKNLYNKMLISKIHALYSFRELFSYIPGKLFLRLIKYNKYLNKKFEITSENYKKYFFRKKIENYNYDYIKDYFQGLSKYFSLTKLNKEEIKKMCINGISKNQNFNLKLSDEDFDLVFHNPYFRNNIRINLNDLLKENIPRFILLNENELKEKTKKVLSVIYNSFTNFHRMNKKEASNYLTVVCGHEISEEDNRVNQLFRLYDTKSNGFINYENFCKYYFDFIHNNINIVWAHFRNLGYNNLLETDINLNYLFDNLNNLEKKNQNIFFNLLKISDKKIQKITLTKTIEKKFIEFLKDQKQIFLNLEKLDISILNLEPIIELQIIFPNVDELSLYIDEENFNYNISELKNIFPKMNTLNIHIMIKYNFFDLISSLKNTEVTTLKIFIFDDINLTIESNIILEKIHNLEIRILKGFMIDFLYNFFERIDFPNLREYILNFEFKELTKNTNIKSGDNDYNIVNKLLIDLRKNFNSKLLFKIPNKLKSIKTLKLNLDTFIFTFKKKKEQKYLFRFINNGLEKLYNNIDLIIDNEEIKKYKKIDIKGMSNLKENITSLIEKEDVNLCDLNFNIQVRDYYIKSYEDLRSIYCEQEIHSTNLLKILKMINFKDNNIRYINLTIDYLNNEDTIIFELIKYSKKLKSLILRINCEINIQIIFQSIENLKFLKIVNITGINNKQFLKVKLENTKLINNLFYFDEFKINSHGFNLKNKNNLHSYIICEYKNSFSKIKLLGNNEEIKKRSKLYLNNERLKTLRYIFYNFGVSKIKIMLKGDFIDTKKMFVKCDCLTKIDLSYFNSKSINNMSYMFSKCSSLTSINLSNFNTDNVEDMSGMFSSCIKLEDLDLSNFNTNKTKNMSYMFFRCSSLKNLNLSSFITNNVNDMNYMFYQCGALSHLNLSNFKTFKVKNMSWMFYDCSSLKSLDLSNFHTENTKNNYNMFYLNKSLTLIILSNVSEKTYQSIQSFQREFNDKCDFKYKKIKKKYN